MTENMSCMAIRYSKCHPSLSLSLSLYIYIYIYMCVCEEPCFYVTNKWQTSIEQIKTNTSKEINDVTRNYLMYECCLNLSII